MKKKLLFLVIMFALAVDLARAATVTGNVYDPALRKVYNAVVEVNTIPMQRFLTVNGTYSFSMAKGQYRITAHYDRAGNKLSTSENLTVIDDGNYVLDLFLYSELGDDTKNETDVNISLPIVEEQKPPVSVPRQMPWPAMFLGGGGILVVTMGLYITTRRKTSSGIETPDDNLKRIIKLLKNNDGRMTQKDISRHFDFTDAKVSLMLTELEDMRWVRKIRKGRANVIVLSR